MSESSLLKLTQAWQKAIAAELWRSQSPLFKLEQHRIIVQWTTLVLCLYFCERQRLLPVGTLQTISTMPDVDRLLVQTWQTCCDAATDTACWFNLDQKLPAPLLQSIIHSLFYPQIDQFAQTPVEILGQIYESTLRCASPIAAKTTDRDTKSTATFRKLSGIYYTPVTIVQSMVQAALAHLPDDKLPRILDPACGSGAFLLAAYQAQSERQLQAVLSAGTAEQSTRLQQNSQQLSTSERQRLLQSIYGVDLDPQAVMISQLSLWLKAQNEAEPIPFRFNPNIRCGNAVIDTDYDSCSVSQSFLTADSVQPFHWQTEFPEVFQTGGFDLVIGNPPYVDAEWMTAHLPGWRTYCAAHYQTASGNWDLFCVFIERALQLCRAQGITSLIVPNKLFSADYAQAARRLLRQHRMLSMTDHSDIPIFAASVYPVVYVAQKLSNPEQSTLTDLKTDQETDQADASRPASPKPLTAEVATWWLDRSDQVNLMQRLEALPKLKDWVAVFGAATVAEAYQLKALIQNRPQLQSDDLPLVNSGTIDRYRLLWGQKRLRYLGQTYLHPAVAQTDLQMLSSRRFAQAMQPKIIVAGMSRQLECAVDLTGSLLAGKSTTIIQISADPNCVIDLRYLLALLNSRLLSHYVRLRFRGNQLQGGYLRIGPAQLRSLPLILPDLKQTREHQIYDQIIERVNQRLKLVEVLQSNSEPAELNETIQAIDTQIDQQVEQIYQLTDTELQTLVAAGDSARIR